MHNLFKQGCFWDYVLLEMCNMIKDCPSKHSYHILYDELADHDNMQLRILNMRFYLHKVFQQSISMEVLLQHIRDIHLTAIDEEALSPHAENMSCIIVVPIVLRTFRIFCYQSAECTLGF